MKPKREFEFKRTGIKESWVPSIYNLSTHNPVRAQALDQFKGFRSNLVYRYKR